MKLLPVLVLFSFAAEAAGPIRILYLGKEGTPSSKRAPVLMQEFGREAIWFDYVADPSAATPEFLAKFDAVLLDAPRADFPMLSGIDPKRVIPAEAASDQREWTRPGFLNTMRDRLLAATSEPRRKEWEQFVAGREAEKREPNAHVANYEKRAEPVTFQAPMSIKGSMERTQVPPDMRLELFASEPDIAKPIAMAWDERGRCWVAETSDYPHDVSPNGAGNDRIKICEDTNGDGKADKFTVFADKLNIPTSLVFARGGIIVAQPPQFLFLQDTNGDDKADVREVVMEGWGVKDTHAQASSLHYGFDNWLYGCVGYSGFKGTVGGKQREFGMGTYRFKADGSALEFLHQFSNNAWAHSQNAAGDQFGGTANNAPIFYGGIPAGLTPPGLRITSAKRINVEDKAHAITPNFRQVDVFGGYTSAAGSAFIYSANLPPRLQGKALVTEPTMKLIALMDVQPQGAGYVAKDAFNLVASSDEWMSPVFAEVGPDGAVWFADWQNFIIQHNPTPSPERGGYAARTGVGGAHENPLRDHARGRIYRVVWEKAQKPAVTSLKGASTPDLVRALGDNTQHWRLTAQRLLVDGKKTEAVELLKRAIIANDGSTAALHALWSLQGLGALDEPTHKSALLAKDPALRRNAIRALGTDQKAEALLFGAGVVSDPQPHTRLAAFVKLAELPTTPEVQTLVRNLSMDAAVKSDEWLAEAAKLLGKRHKAQSYQEGPNLLPNPDFELVGADGLPQGWSRRDYGNRPANAGAEWKVISSAGAARGGKNAVQCITRGDADTSLHADIPVKPNTDYRLSGWLKTHALRGRASLNVHGSRHETERATARESGWTEVEVIFNSNNLTVASVNLLHVATGDSLFDDVRLSELVAGSDASEKAPVGLATRGEQIFFKHATAACTLCHVLKGQGSAVGPALDGIAARKDAKYLEESLTEPNKVLAEGFQQLGVSPMPPMGLILKPQELEDVKAYLQTLK
ncbi:MAG TPA: PVC-type heme-binding CxxCH protein [Chthoniobacteraceae bacterium]|nr:PVC-type heme-binding CxxCH protein [Chthoniobacteraceae bacterium]